MYSIIYYTYIQSLIIYGSGAMVVVMQGYFDIFIKAWHDEHLSLRAKVHTGHLLRGEVAQRNTAETTCS